MHDPGQDDNPHKCQHEQRRVVRRPAYFNGDALVQKVDRITDRAEQCYAFPFWKNQPPLRDRKYHDKKGRHEQAAQECVKDVVLLRDFPGSFIHGHYPGYE